MKKARAQNRIPQQTPLFDGPKPAAWTKRRVELAVDKAVRLAQSGAEPQVTALDAAIIAVARAQARAIDVAEAKGETWSVFQGGRELAGTLARLRLDPVSRGAAQNHDALADFLASLAQPETASGAQVGDTENV